MSDTSATAAIPAGFRGAAAEMEVVAPADELVAELKQSALARQPKALIAALSAGELGTWNRSWSPFLCLYGFHQYTGSLDGFPAWDGGIDPVSGRPTHAAGVLQDEPATWREIAAMTGRHSFYPQDQIANNWVLAVRDFAVHGGGGDLLAALQVAGTDNLKLSDIAAKLRPTWPGGADVAFPARYVAALASLQDATPAEAIPPLRPGMQAIFPVVGIDQDGQPFTPIDALVSDDPEICEVQISDDGVATITAVAAGETTVHGADLSLSVTVEDRRLVHLTADLSRLVISRPMVVAAMMALSLLAPRALSPDPRVTYFPPLVVAATPAALDAVDPIVQRLPSIPGNPTFCLAGSGPRGVVAVSLDQCRAR